VVDLQNNKWNVSRWYDLSKKISPTNGSERNADTFLKLMKDSVNLRLRSDVKVGSCLSGGLDSSTIVCLVNELLKEKNKSEIQETVSSCFAEKQFDESTFIDVVVEKTKVKSHKVFPQFSELFSLLDKITWHQDNPIGSTSVFAQWNVFKTAKENQLIVMLDGQGADESLAGYHPFYDLRFKSLLSGLKFGQWWKEVRAFQKMHKHTNSHVAQLLLKTILPTGLLSSGVQHIRSKKYEWLKVPYQFYNPFHNLRARDIQQYSLMQLGQSSLPMLLHYEDRNSMAFSIESRVPFLDYRLVEFIVNLSDEEKINNGRTKFVLRKALKNIVPDKILTRYDKMGFVTPESVWVKNNAEFFEQKLSEALDLFTSIIDKNLFLHSFREAKQKDLLMGSIYWRIIALGVWVKTFNVSISND
jgi:asparagine synthase (glutamine-hydrolysing)